MKNFLKALTNFDSDVTIFSLLKTYYYIGCDDETIKREKKETYRKDGCQQSQLQTVFVQPFLYLCAVGVGAAGGVCPADLFVYVQHRDWGVVAIGSVDSRIDCVVVPHQQKRPPVDENELDLDDLAWSRPWRADVPFIR